jgi:hypothetical protein
VPRTRTTGSVTLLEFQARREADSASWTRADPDAALIERIAWNTWLMVLPDGEHVHEVTLEKRHGTYVGDCGIRGGDRCPARKYGDRDAPCGHLCTIRKGLVYVSLRAQFNDRRRGTRRDQQNS